VILPEKAGFRPFSIKTTQNELAQSLTKRFPAGELVKILAVDQFLPYPPVDGSSLREFNLLKHLSRCHDVALISLFRSSIGEDDGADYLRTLCSWVDLVPRRQLPRLERWMWLPRALLKGEPRKNLSLYSQAMVDRIRTRIEEDRFDIVDIRRSCMAPYVRAVPANSGCRTVLTLHDVPYVQHQRILSVERNWRVRWNTFKDWLFLKRATLKYARCFDKCVVVSGLDRDILQRDAPDLDIAVVPNGVDTESYALLAAEVATPTLLFVGKMHYPPNVDAVLFFCSEILPIIKQQIPDVKLLIVGRDPVEPVQALASEDVTVTGYVESVIPYYEQACVSVIPLRAGGGTRLKILESMALGRSVVSTTLGCEGLEVTHGENILIADSPAEFAAQTVRLLEDEALRRKLVTHGRQLVETTYDWQAIAQRLLRIYNELLGKESGMCSEVGNNKRGECRLC